MALTALIYQLLSTNITISIFVLFVNTYRLNELEKALIKDPQSTNEALAQQSGFGSISSMKRSVQAGGGISFSEWKDKKTKGL
ncbi:MAG: hypothetical protein WCK78_08010 [Paludibacter sp.]